MTETSTVNLYQSIGVIGFVFYITAYFLLQTGKIKGGDTRYSVLNFAAASLVLISLSHDFNLASALIQVTWILISLLGLLRQQHVKTPIKAGLQRSNYRETKLIE